MLSKTIIPTALLLTLTVAQSNNFNINSAEESKLVNDLSNYISTLEASPPFQSDVSAIIPDLPASVVQQAAADPAALLDSIADASTLPAWVSAIPTTVLTSLETLAARPLSADVDINAYIASLTTQPSVQSIISVLQTAVPVSVQSSIENAPVEFLASIITATTTPSWASDIPVSLQSAVGSIFNEGLSIVDNDINAGSSTAVVANGSGNAPPSPTTTVPNSGFLPVVYVKPTGTGAASVLAFNGTSGSSPAGNPIVFEGSAAPLRTVARGLGLLVAGAVGMFLGLRM